MRRAALILAAPCLAVAVGGCSLAGNTSANSGSFTGIDAPVAVALNQFANDASSNNAKDMCDNVLDKRIVTALNRASSCTTAITAQLKTIDDFTLTVKTVDVSGNTATAQVQTVHAGKKTLSKVRLVRESGVWRVDSVL